MALGDKCKDCSIIITEETGIEYTNTNGKTYYRRRCKNCEYTKRREKLGFKSRVSHIVCRNEGCGTYLIGEQLVEKKTKNPDGTYSMRRQGICRACYYKYNQKKQQELREKHTPKVCDTCEKSKAITAFTSYKKSTCSLCEKKMRKGETKDEILAAITERDLKEAAAQKRREEAAQRKKEKELKKAQIKPKKKKARVTKPKTSKVDNKPKRMITKAPKKPTVIKPAISNEELRDIDKEYIKKRVDSVASSESQYKGVDRSICRPNTKHEDNLIAEFLAKREVA